MYRLDWSSDDYTGWRVIDDATGKVVAVTVIADVSDATPDEKRFADGLIAILNNQPSPRLSGSAFTLDDRERATVLAALSYWQQDLIDGEDEELGVVPGDSEIATQGGTLEALNHQEIGALIDRIEAGPLDSPVTGPDPAEMRSILEDIHRECQETFVDPKDLSLEWKAIDKRIVGVLGITPVAN